MYVSVIERDQLAMAQNTQDVIKGIDDRVPAAGDFDELTPAQLQALKRSADTHQALNIRK